MINKIPINIFDHEHAYPLIFVHKKTNEVLCEICARGLNINEYNDYVFDYYLEGDTLDCDICYEIIESVYGPIK